MNAAAFAKGAPSTMARTRASGVCSAETRSSNAARSRRILRVYRVNSQLPIPNSQLPTPNSQRTPISNAQELRLPGLSVLGVGSWELGVGNYERRTAT